MCRWLKVQAHLKSYHEDLQLALEASSLYHQADSILSAIRHVVNSPSTTKTSPIVIMKVAQEVEWVG